MSGSDRGLEVRDSGFSGPDREDSTLKFFVGNNNNNNTNSRAYSNRGGPCEVVREPTETAGEKTRVEEYQVPADYKRQGLCSHQGRNKSSSTTRTYSYKPEN